jgi:adenosylcobinamide-phosphate synthase
MKFLALLAVLLLEQVRPLHEDNHVHRWLGQYAAITDRYFNAGEYRHGLVAWIVFVGSIVAVAALIFHALNAMSALLGLLWGVAVLYLTMGFRRFSDHYTEIQQALRAGDVSVARERLGRWRGEGVGEFGATEVASVAIEQGLLASHRQVFGTMAWFVVLGPAGAILYRLAAMLEEKWGRRTDGEAGEFGRFSTQAFYWIDWVPARLTAASLAIVGNFEDAAYCWRMQAHTWSPHGDGIILASGAGALGVRLSGVVHSGGGLEPGPELGTGAEADVDHMHGAAGLIWRALVLWMFLVLVVSLAHALG